MEEVQASGCIRGRSRACKTVQARPMMTVRELAPHAREGRGEQPMDADFYDDPERQKPAGPARRRQRPIKSVLIPVRFAPDMIEAVKHFASRDGLTVSGWIRRLVARELQRLQPTTTTQVGQATFQPSYDSSDHGPQTLTASLPFASR